MRHSLTAPPNGSSLTRATSSRTRQAIGFASGHIALAATAAVIAIAVPWLPIRVAAVVVVLAQLPSLVDVVATARRSSDPATARMQVVAMARRAPVAELAALAGGSAMLPAMLVGPPSVEAHVVLAAGLATPGLRYLFMSWSPIPELAMAEHALQPTGLDDVLRRGARGAIGNLRLQIVLAAAITVGIPLIPIRPGIITPGYVGIIALTAVPVAIGGLCWGMTPVLRMSGAIVENGRLQPAAVHAMGRSVIAARPIVLAAYVALVAASTIDRVGVVVLACMQALMIAVIVAVLHVWIAIRVGLGDPSACGRRFGTFTRSDA